MMITAGTQMSAEGAGMSELAPLSITPSLWAITAEPTVEPRRR